MAKNIEQDKKKIVSAGSHCGDRELRTAYSGRCMFGATCYGIVCDDPEDVIAEVGVKGARTDSMGLHIIVYWPHVSDDQRQG